MGARACGSLNCGGRRRRRGRRREGQGFGHRLRRRGLLGPDGEEARGLLLRFQIEVVLANDGLGVAGLECGLAHRAELRDVHGNERVPHDVVSEAERLCDGGTLVLEVGRDDREAVQREGAEPRGKVGLNRDAALHADFRDLGLDQNDASVEAHVLGPEFQDLTRANAGSDAGEEREGEERDERAAVDLLDVTHELFGLLGTQGLGRAAPMGDAQVRHLFQWVGGHPVLAEGVFEEGEEDAAAVVEGLRLRVATLAVGGKGVAGEGRQDATWEGLVEVFEAKANVLQLALGEHATLVLQLLRGEVGGSGLMDLDLALGRAVVGEGVVEIERQRLGRALEATERGLGFVELLVSEPRRGGADAGGGLNELQLQGLLLGGSLGAGGEVFADALSVEPAGDTIGDLTGGI